MAQMGPCALPAHRTVVVGRGWRSAVSWHGAGGFGVRLPLPAWSCAVAAGGTVSRWAASMWSEHVSGFSVLKPPPLYPLWVIRARGAGNLSGPVDTRARVSMKVA
jgi:hypothetical protein